MVQLWRAFGYLVPLFLIIIFIVGIAVYFVSRKRKLEFKRVTVNTLFSLSIIGILLVTVYPQYYGTEVLRIINLVPFIGMYDIMFNSVDITVPIRNLGLNILLFIPFGFFLSIRKSALQKKFMLNVILTGMLFSFLIEVIQFSIPMGRSADIDDLILNTFGVFLGYITWKIFNSIYLNISLTNKPSKSHI